MWIVSKHIHNESGVALLLAMILMMVFSLLTVSLFELLKASTQISGNYRLALRTMYIADAGAEDAISELRSDPDWSVGLSDEPFGDGTYTVNIIDGSPSNPAIFAEKDIISTGTISSFQKTLQVHVKIIRIGGSSPTAYAVATTSWKEIPNP